MVTEQRTEFLQVWEDWDKKPSDTTTAGRMEDACQVLSKETEIPASVLRDMLSDARRSGHTREEALQTLIPPRGCRRI